MQSKLQQRVDAAWPSIEEQVKEALGKAADRALRTAFDVVDVDAPSPVLVRDVTSAGTRTDQCGGGSVMDSSFSAKFICLRHRRYCLPVTEIELEMLKASRSSSDATARNKIRDWAKAVLGREGRLVVEALVKAAARRVTGPVTPELVKEACQQMIAAGHPNASSSPLRLVSAGPVKTTAAHKDLRRALHGGTIVEVPVDKPLASDTLGVVPRPGRGRADGLPGSRPRARLGSDGGRRGGGRGSRPASLAVGPARLLHRHCDDHCRRALLTAGAVWPTSPPPPAR